MKKILIFLASLSVLAASAVPAPGQGKINTKKARLADFTSKTTRVVLSGSDMFNNALREEITAQWRISPYEFCTLDEYLKEKESNSCYYLIAASTKSGHETTPGIMVLCLEKGGKKDISDASSGGFEVLSIPCASVENPSGREFVFLPAFITIMQRYVTDAMNSDRVGYGGLASYKSKDIRNKSKKIYFSEDDIADPYYWESEWTGRNLIKADEDEADEIFSKNTENALVSYVVAPSDPGDGAACYKMIISADTYELCYFEQQRIRAEMPAGFQAGDLKRISLGRKK